MSRFAGHNMRRRILRILAGSAAIASRPPFSLVLLLGIHLLGVRQAVCAQSISPALEGRVLNGTTNQPAPNVQVEYLLLREGMVPAEVATTDAQGRFRFQRAEPLEGPALVRVQYQGASYSQSPAAPGGLSGSLEIRVFEASGEASLVQAKEHAIFLHPTADNLVVLEQIVLENASSPPKTYVHPEETYRFSLPAAPREGVRVSVQGPGGLPLNQTPTPTSQQNQFTIAYPMRPGETEVRLEYALNYQQPFEFSKPLDWPAEQTHIVTPGEGVEVSGESLVALGSDPTTGFIGYRVTPAGNVVQFQVSGEAPALARAESASEASGSLVPIPDPVNERRWVVLGLLGVVLLAGFFYHYWRS